MDEISYIREIKTMYYSEGIRSIPRIVEYTKSNAVALHKLFGEYCSKNREEKKRNYSARTKYRTLGFYNPSLIDYNITDNVKKGKLTVKKNRFAYDYDKFGEVVYVEDSDVKEHSFIAHENECMCALSFWDDDATISDIILSIYDHNDLCKLIEIRIARYDLGFSGQNEEYQRNGSSDFTCIYTLFDSISDFPYMSCYEDTFEFKNYGLSDMKWDRLYHREYGLQMRGLAVVSTEVPMDIVREEYLRQGNLK